MSYHQPFVFYVCIDDKIQVLHNKKRPEFLLCLLLHKCFYSPSTFNYDCPADMGKSAVTQMTKMQNSAYHNEVS